MADAYFAQGCFWGAEKVYWDISGVTATEVGYMGGTTLEPTYEQVCERWTKHAETVHVTFDPEIITFAELVRVFLESHDPTQKDKQGNDIGTQYRSAIFVTDDAQRATAESEIAAYQPHLNAAGYSYIRTEIDDSQPTFWPAEEPHQKYLRKNPGGYCPIHATGVRCG